MLAWAKMGALEVEKWIGSGYIRELDELLKGWV